jgi:N-acetylglutamate synthase-like GNAT family acetyltransferase
MSEEIHIRETLLIETEIDGDVVSRMIFEQYPERKDQACLRHVEVLEQYRGTGVGRRLVDRALGVCKEIGVTHLGVCSEPESVGFWRKMGFVENGESSDPPCVDMWREVSE